MTTGFVVSGIMGQHGLPELVERLILGCYLWESRSGSG